jgi:hypothetical protein
MYNFYSNKSNKYKQKYINSYKQNGGQYYDNNRDFNYSRGGYDNRYDDYEYSRERYDRNYNGGNWFSPPDPINKVFKNINNTNPDLLSTQIWKGQNVKNSRKTINVYGYNEKKYFTFRFNWELEDGPVLAYITTIKTTGLGREMMHGEIEEGEPIYKPIKLYIVECNNNKCDEGYYLDSEHFDKRPLDNIDKYLFDLAPYITDDIDKFFKQRKSRGGYERYIDDYPRRGGYNRYMDDYYSDSMHGGALGEFRKEIS